MTDLSLALPRPTALPLAPKLALAAALVCLGDLLFYDARLGISVPVFLAALAGASLLEAWGRAPGRVIAMALAGLALALLPLVESLGWPQALLGIGAVAVFAVAASGAWAMGVEAVLAAAGKLLAAGPFQALSDLLGARLFGSGTRWPAVTVKGLLGWAIPLGLCAVFAGLFAQANPLIDAWLSALDPSALLRRADPLRVLFWGGLLALVWPFVAVKIREVRTRPVTGSGDPAILASRVLALDGSILGRAAILRSLVLFNLLFAVQTALDALFLWGGVRLPDGMTYAAYAHRGAHPLIATALLAAGFVLVAMRPGGPGEGSRAIRLLVYAFVAQNVGLVVSSLLRLDLYVEAYSLTLMRAAAGIWMGLVAVGLVLIVARIALGKSNRWLVGANLLALGLTLYACAFVNFPSEVARFNDRHSEDRVPGGRRLDGSYLLELGPHALPVLDRYLDRRGSAAPVALARRRNAVADAHLLRMRDWRAWTFRDWRLKRYLERRQGAIAFMP